MVRLARAVMAGMLVAGLVTPAAAAASGFSGAQVQSIVSLLSAFGVSTADIQRVDALLAGAPAATSTPARPQQPPKFEHGTATPPRSQVRNYAPPAAAAYAAPAGADATPPTISITAPLATLPSNTTQTALSATTSEPANCAYTTHQFDTYAAMTPFDSTGSTTHDATLTGLTASSSNTYYVSCEDRAGNVGGPAVITFYVASTSGQTLVNAATTTQTTSTSTQPYDFYSTRVETTARVHVRQSACNTGKPGTQEAGAVGNVTAGPTAGCGYSWLKVDFDTGPSGWVDAAYLATSTYAAAASTTPTTFEVGVGVVTTAAALNIHSQPSRSASTVLCAQPSGTAGYITGGPLERGGYTWWNVDYVSGCNGWSAQAYLAPGNF